MNLRFAASCVVVSLSVCLLAPAAPAAETAPAGKEVADKAAPILPAQVQMTGWLGRRVEANGKNRLMAVSMEERLRPFRSPTEKGGWSGEHIGKWLHAAAITWSYSHDAELRKRMDEAVTSLAASQDADGYLGTYGKQFRWSDWDVWAHKYDLLGLLADYQYTGDERALAVARKIGDLLIATFGQGKRDIVASGPHVGMAPCSVLEPMVLLYRATKDARYLDFARYIVRAYDQPNGPKIVASLTKTHSVAATANRKAYEMMSNIVGLCEVYRSTGDEVILQACEAAAADIAENQMYITGGTSLGEHFQNPHSLPNTGAVSEGCAHVTWEQLCLQLLRITAQAKYADLAERIIYNHLLAQQKPSGDALCYFTPLAGRKPYDKGMNCCTSSGPRGIALATTFAYMQSAPAAVMVNFYEPSTFEAELGGAKVKIAQATKYPLDGAVELAVDPAAPATFDLLLRIPGWCKGAKATLNGAAVDTPAEPGTYLKLSRQWKAGDKVALDLPMPAVLVKGTFTNDVLVAMQRGPLVLAFDARLNAGLTAGRVTPVAGADGVVAMTVATDPDGIAAHAFKAEGLVPEVVNDEVTLKKVPLVLTSFAEAGQTGSTYAVWMPSPERLKSAPAHASLLLKESWSREGNVQASIVDGDTTTFRVTFDGKSRPEEDWFAVESEQPVTINAVTYAHGKTFHDGGWLDASKAKPRIQARKAAGGAWEDLAVLETYPATTATDSKGLADGAAFTVRFEPAKVVAIRVIGTPACGDNAKQAFSSCAELEGSMAKGK